MAIAVVAIVAYWGHFLFSDCLDVEVAWPVEFLLYYVHYAAWGGLIGALFTIRRKRSGHAAFWGAVIGLVLSALLMV